MLSESQKKLLLKDPEHNISFFCLDEAYQLVELTERDDMLMCRYKPDQEWCYFSFNANRDFIRDFFDAHDGIQPVVILDQSLFEWITLQYRVHYSIDCFRLFLRKVDFSEPDADIVPLQPADLQNVYHTSKYQNFLSMAYLHNRLRLGGGYCIRAGDMAVAWIMTHDDGSVGMLHVLDEYRGRGFARRLVMAMSRDRHRKGKAVFAHIEPNNRASLNLFESLGYEASGRHTWAYVSRS